MLEFAVERIGSGSIEHNLRNNPAIAAGKLRLVNSLDHPRLHHNLPQRHQDSRRHNQLDGVDNQSAEEYWLGYCSSKLQAGAKEEC